MIVTRNYMGVDGNVFHITSEGISTYKLCHNIKGYDELTFYSEYNTADSPLLSIILKDKVSIGHEYGFDPEIRLMSVYIMNNNGKTLSRYVNGFHFNSGRFKDKKEVDRVFKNISKNDRIKKAIEQANKECIEEGILRPSED